jgi:threonine aldolase
MPRTFASDNNAPVAPDILRALEASNDGDVVGYGEDRWTQAAVERFHAIFGDGVDVYFAFNGTGANVLALSSALRPHEAVIAPDSAHLNTDECGALERFAGTKIVVVAARDGKLHPDDLRPLIGKAPDQHHVVPRAISISQATEFGTVYTLAEVRALCELAHDNGLFVHMDGARIANAAVALGVGLRGATRDVGVDILTFGGTKNGLMFGEAVVYFDPALHAGTAAFARKQTTQLASKMRYIAAQFDALLENDRWKTYASHANAMTARLAQRVSRMTGVAITRPIDINAIFATLDRAAVERLQSEFFFYIFNDAPDGDETRPEVRWMTHHATREEDVDAFADALERALAG